MNVPELASNVITLVVILLPLSSLWAGSSLEDEARNRASNHTSDSHRHLFNLGASNNTTTTTTTATSATATRSPAKQRDPELSKYGISVEHDISVQSYHKDGPEEEV